MTHRERFEAVFRKRKPDKPPWDPRIDHWFRMNRKWGTIPKRYEGLTLQGLHKELDAGIRIYLGPYVRYREGSGIEEKTWQEGELIITETKTPKGTLRSARRLTEDSSYIVEFPIKDISDFEIMEYVLRNQEYGFNEEVIKEVEREYEDTLGSIFFCYGHTPVQRLILDYMGFEEAHYALYDHPKETERFLKAIEETDDPFFELAERVPIEQINFGDHIHDWLISPSIFKKWHLPYYQRRNEQLHKAGKFTHCHVDGDAKLLLPLFKDSGFDALEALTPLPQGPWTVRELKDVLGDEIILMDGIPATAFLPFTPVEELRRTVSEILELFWPSGNLVLGISDELPPGGDIERVRMISEMIEKEV
jgi:hypothetical protein